MKKQERKLKVGYKFQERAYRQSVITPEIKLCGKWLKESGFSEGQDVKIVVQNKKLIITPILEQVAEPNEKYKSKKK